MSVASLSDMVIEFAERNTDLTREIHQRHDEGGDGNNEKDGDASLVLNLKKRTHKTDDDHYAYRDTSHEGPEDRAIYHRGASDETWKVRLEPASRLIVIGNKVQVD